MLPVRNNLVKIEDLEFDTEYRFEKIYMLHLILAAFNLFFYLIKLQTIRKILDLSPKLQLSYVYLTKHTGCTEKC